MNKIYSKIESISGSVITVRAEGIKYNELAEIETAFGTSLAEVNRIDGDLVSLQVFAGGRGVSTGDKIRFLGREMEVCFSENLMGRIFNGSGEPRDKGPSLKDNNELLARIAMQAEVDVIVLGGMGLKYDDYLYFKNTLEEGGALSRTVMFVHTAADPTVECLKIPDMSLAVAEQFALQGKDVLVLLTDMTNFADAMKEIAITQEQVPSNRGYPGDLYSQLASRYEKAVDFDDAGSVTILAVTTMPGDDVTHPVPDNTGYITEGQFYLKGGRIEPFGSLSRLKQNVNGKTRDDHRALMDGMIRLYSSYKDTLEKKSMGFMMSEWDEKLLKYGELFEKEMMDLSVNIPLEGALDKGWAILAACFKSEETGLKSELIAQYWPKN